MVFSLEQGWVVDPCTHEGSEGYTYAYSKHNEIMNMIVMLREMASLSLLVRSAFLNIHTCSWLRLIRRNRRDGTRARTSCCSPDCPHGRPSLERLARA
ncbi:hypothetical protein M407DRAFT_173786 [Tulasnella calospora MUT 4182]|uniref:Uncharacterized protein n=1 Tax=Tulasnella calospora MUT 4182 TaxID=1051891 RepID=A0A0C3QMI9_9AGAM|nr:hypothetical protein M407DRAFT_173786 [Tulasnella calospora MUT 4182]